MNGSDDRGVVTSARLAVAGAASGTVVLALLVVFADFEPRSYALALPAGLIGIVSPAIGYRLYAWLRERAAAAGESTADGTGRAFLRATILAVAVTDAAAVFGLVAYLLSGAPIALTGIATHVILAGAIWPTDERLAGFLDLDGPPRTDA